jgi:hypothetical protein
MHEDIHQQAEQEQDHKNIKEGGRPCSAAEEVTRTRSNSSRSITTSSISLLIFVLS